MTRPTTRWLLLALLAAPVGCFDQTPVAVADDAATQDDVAPVDDVAPADDLVAAPDAPDAARDAGLDAPVDVALTIGCTRDDACAAAQHCDLATHACVDGCHADEGCAGASADGGSSAADASTGAALRCDPAAHACVACLTDEHCPLGHVCRDRACAPGCTATRACPAGGLCCAGACADPQTSATNCGACAAVCAIAHGAAACVAGRCAVATCAATYGDCDGDASNGCETDTATTLAHCGACGAACAPPGATGACAAGRCAVGACAAGRGDCDGEASNGCEVDTATAALNCGVCGRACAGGESCAAGACVTPRSCREIHAALPALPNGAYAIDPDGAGGEAPFGIYCDMTSDGGGWTLALKADGARGTFAYDAPLWSSADTLAPASTNLDPVEAKFASFARVPFTAVRLALVDGGTTRAVVIPFHASDSLLAVFAPGTFQPTEISRAGWTGLLASPSLQPFCNREGFNNNAPGYTRVRLGILANQENECASPDSRIGLGGQGLTCNPALGNNTVGNSASCSADNGDRDTRAFGYLFVR